VRISTAVFANFKYSFYELFFYCLPIWNVKQKGAVELLGEMIKPYLANILKAKPIFVTNKFDTDESKAYTYNMPNKYFELI